jgi:Ala-tRNA(Pro) deacylase
MFGKRSKPDPTRVGVGASSPRVWRWDRLQVPEEVVGMSTVAKHLQRQGVAFELVPHSKAYTTIDEARALGISADEVVKTVAVKTGSGYALVILPGGQRLHMKLVRKAVADSHARLATEEELERAFPEFELGALPPLGSLLGAPAFVDPEVLEHETILFAGGTQTESLKVRSEDLFRAEPATVLLIVRRPEGKDER